MNTRPNGLHTPAQPVAERDPNSLTAQVDEAQQRRARAAERRAHSIEWTPPVSDYELARLRLGRELAVEAANRGVTLREMLGTRLVPGVRR